MEEDLQVLGETPNLGGHRKLEEEEEEEEEEELQGAGLPYQLTQLPLPW